MRARELALIVLPFTAACSLLVQFVDAPDANFRDASDDAPVDAAPDAQDDAPDAFVDVYDASQLCIGLPDGWYCGLNGLNGSPPAEWLVNCVNASPIVRVCDGGCLPFPSGTSDRCNECPGMPNGYYCGSQFPTYAADNANYRIGCSNGLAVIEGSKCVNGCQPGPGNATCK